MTSASIRDALADHLITPQNSALIVIDYQLKNIVSTVKATGPNNGDRR